jgi:type 1 fimbriae regulatory protein FimB
MSTSSSLTGISVQRRRGAAKGNPISFLSPEELLAVLKVARGKSVRDWAMILLAYGHGLRSAEVCGLRLVNVNVKKRSISVQRLMGSLRTTQPLREHSGQPLLDETSAVREWLKERPPDASNYLFTSRKGGALDKSQFFRIFQTTAEGAGLSRDKRYPRLLRHSLALHLVAGNVNLDLIKQALGHSSIISTMRYVRPTSADAAEAVQSALTGIFYFSLLPRDK